MSECRECLGGARNAEVQALLAELKACSRALNLERGKQVHAEAAKSGDDSNIYVASALINMYSKCGSILEAHQVFHRVPHPNVVSWTALILGYAETGQGFAALDLFRRMNLAGILPDPVALVAALKACTSLVEKEERGKCRKRGMQVHILGLLHGCDSNVKVQNSLMDMYCKCGSMRDVLQVFGAIHHPCVSSWTVLIMGYADSGQGITALNLFRRMRLEGPAPDSVTFIAALKACTSLPVSGLRHPVKLIHDLSVENGCDAEIHVQSTLIDIYAKCGCMVCAHQVFDHMENPNAVAWNALILGYATNGEGLSALDIFTKMVNGKPAPDSVTFVAALKACSSLALKGVESVCRERGRELHDLAVKSGFYLDMKVQNTLLDMYAKCGCIVDARQVFDSMKHPNVVSWTAMILGYADNGRALVALDLFRKMKSSGPAPNFVTLGAVLKACGLVGGLEFGRTVHTQMTGDLDVVLVTCLVDFYAKCGSLTEAKDLFDVHAGARDIVTWTALLSGFSSCGHYVSAFELFQCMQDAGLRPDGVTFLCILACCSHAGLVEKGKECFDAMSTKYGMSPTIEHYNCMVDMFGRSNMFGDAMALLERMPCAPNDVTWKTVLGACHKWKNVEIGRLAFDRLTSSASYSGGDAACYVLMGQIYESRGMFQEQDSVMALRSNLKTPVEPGEACWMNEVGVIHTFLTLGEPA